MASKLGYRTTMMNEPDSIDLVQWRLANSRVLKDQRIAQKQKAQDEANHRTTYQGFSATTGEALHQSTDGATSPGKVVTNGWISAGDEVLRRANTIDSMPYPKKPKKPQKSQKPQETTKAAGWWVNDNGVEINLEATYRYYLYNYFPVQGGSPSYRSEEYLQRLFLDSTRNTQIIFGEATITNSSVVKFIPFVLEGSDPPVYLFPFRHNFGYLYNIDPLNLVVNATYPDPEIPHIFYMIEHYLDQLILGLRGWAVPVILCKRYKINLKTKTWIVDKDFSFRTNLQTSVAYQYDTFYYYSAESWLTKVTSESGEKRIVATITPYLSILSLQAQNAIIWDFDPYDPESSSLFSVTQTYNYEFSGEPTNYVQNLTSFSLRHPNFVGSANKRGIAISNAITNVGSYVSYKFPVGGWLPYSVIKQKKGSSYYPANYLAENTISINDLSYEALLPLEERYSSYLNKLKNKFSVAKNQKNRPHIPYFLLVPGKIEFTPTVSPP